MAAGFQEAVVKVLVEKSLQACRQKRLKSLVVGGGGGKQLFPLADGTRSERGGSQGLVSG